tara:strand:- start:2 stop:2584 length:2583 start_codon:yes stop_codon:yes gene_type:complete
MTNLADLLPAGGGQNNTDFVADGNISAGAPVILTSDGKATAVAQSSVTEAVGTPVAFGGGVTLSGVACCYDTTNSKVVIAYGDNNDSGYGKAIVGTVSGSTISFGTQVTFAGSGTVGDLSIVFDPDSGKVVIAFRDNSNSGYGTAIVGTVSGTSISFGSAAVFSSSSNNYNSAVYDTSNDKVFISFTNAGSSNVGQGVVGTVSGTSISFGSATTFSSAQPTYPTSSAFDSSENKVVTAYMDGTNGNSQAIVGTISGTSVSFGSATTFTTAYSADFSTAYDANANKILISFEDVANSNYGTAIVGTVSGTSISFGSKAVYEAANGSFVSSVYDSNNQKVVIVYGEGFIAGYSSAVNATISGTSVSFTSPFQLVATYNNPMMITFDSANKKVVEAYNSSGSKALVYTPPGTETNLTATNLLGLAPSAISDTATGTINTWGSRCESSSLLPDGLSLGTAAEVDGTANSVPEAIIYDSNENKVVIPFQNAADSYHGYAAVGTASGDSISFGSPVEFNNGTTNYMMGCFDSSNNKIVIGYADGSNAYYLTVVVGTVSGSSISFGTPVVAESSDAASYQEMAFDSNANKVVIGWKDSGNSNYGSAIVGTVSGTSISFGTKAAFNSALTYVHGVTYDSNAQKVVFSYRDDGTGSGYGRSIVGTVSGTGISFGSATTFDATAYSSGIGSGYDSTNNKVIVGYKDQGNSNYGTAVVGTVSGTSISFGTATAFGSEAMSGAFGHYITEDVSAQKIVIAYDGTTSGKLVSGTVSGTDITFDTPIVTDSTGTGENHITYDSNANKTVLTYQGTSVSYKAMAAVASFGTTPLTVTSDYYVQEDGTLSTTSTSPAQLIGKAIKTNQINIKDYTG